MAAALVAAGCSNQTEQKAREAGQEAAAAARAAGGAVESAADDTVRNVERANDAAQREAAEGAESAKQQGDAAQASLERAGDRASEAVKDAAHATSGAVQTAEVKAALIADSRVDAAAINVDTDDRAKTVTLTGHVPSAAQKLAAGQIAHAKAEGYEVRNELAVRP
jgi:osmotically-inducible protein OsmY